MKLRSLLAIPVLAALPALAAPNCQAPQVLQGNNCTLVTAAGWVIAGQGTATVFNIYVPPNATGPVRFDFTALNSSLGSGYTGYLGLRAGVPGQSDTEIVTLQDVVAGGSSSIGNVNPGEQELFVITEVCWDPTCTAAAPQGAVPNMFSAQILMSSPNPMDISMTPTPRLTLQFLDGNRVNWEGAENMQRANSPVSIVPNINLGATPDTRYTYTGTAVNLPFAVLSVTNLNSPGPITGTVSLQDLQHNTIVKATLPGIPPQGAAGFLVIGRTPGDPLGLFPSSTVLPAGSDGIFHGALEIQMSGLTPAGFNIVRAQEYNGNSMMNLQVIHSPIP